MKGSAYIVYSHNNLKCGLWQKDKFTRMEEKPENPWHGSKSHARKGQERGLGCLSSISKLPYEYGTVYPIPFQLFLKLSEGMRNEDKQPKGYA